MSSIADRLQATRERIARAAAAQGRDPATVRLIAVSKTRPVADLRLALAAGQRDFGENYLQEALPKIATLSGAGICWHFIGPIQANKTRLIAEHFHWVHCLDREKIARRLSQQRPAGQPPLQTCLQVNIDDEASKSGVTAAELPALAAAVAALPGLRLRGLMCIPRAAKPGPGFAHLHELLEMLQDEHPTLDTLSMGMSADLETAIAQGATLVRVGTAIFGPREAG